MAHEHRVFKFCLSRQSSRNKLNTQQREFKSVIALTWYSGTIVNLSRVHLTPKKVQKSSSGRFI